MDRKRRKNGPGSRRLEDVSSRLLLPIAVVNDGSVLQLRERVGGVDGGSMSILGEYKG